MLLSTSIALAIDPDMNKILNCSDLKNGIKKVEKNGNDIIVIVNSEMRIYSIPISCQNYKLVGNDVFFDFRDFYVKNENKLLSFFRKNEPLWHCPMEDSLMGNTFYIINKNLVAFSPNPFKSKQRRILTIDKDCSVKHISDSLSFASFLGWQRSKNSYYAFVKPNGKLTYLATIDSINGSFRRIYKKNTNGFILMEKDFWGFQNDGTIVKNVVGRDSIVSKDLNRQIKKHKNHLVERLIICGDSICLNNYQNDEITIVEEE